MLLTFSDIIQVDHTVHKFESSVMIKKTYHLILRMGI